MNTEQKIIVDQAEGRVRQIRRTLKELDDFGWVPTSTVEPLRAFDAYRGRLALNQANIDAASPTSKKLSELLSEESLLVESLGKLADQAEAALHDEEISFFQLRGSYFGGLDGQIDEANEQIRTGLSWMIDGLQSKWKILQKRQELRQCFQDISQNHNTPESFYAGALQPEKPFPKINQATWNAFVASFLGRLSQTFPGFEAVEPADAVQTIYEKG